MKKSIVILFLLVISSGFSQQTLEKNIETYHQIFDQVRPNTHFLFNRGFLDTKQLELYKLKQENEVEGFVILNPSKWQLLYNSIALSDQSGSKKLKDIDHLMKLDNQEATSPSIIQIGVIDILGEYIDSDLISTYFDKSNQKIKPNAPFKEIQLFGISNLQATVSSADVQFEIDPELYFTNSKNKATGIEIDFDNGKGFQYFQFTKQRVSVHYGSIGKKNIKYKLITPQGTYLSYSTINVLSIKYTKPDKLLQNTSNVNAKVTNEISGAGIYLGCDNKLDKPIIIVEGFEVLSNLHPSDYFAKYNNAGFWNAIKDFGYDLVFVDFPNNQNPIADNASVLENIIQEVNLKKEGHFENIVIGESMGGLVARVALAQMEKNNIDHQVGLYVSFDAPHKGANIPLGIQKLATDALNINLIKVIDSLSDLWTVFASISLNGIGILADIKGLNLANKAIGSLKSPAARNMLIRHNDYLGEISPDFKAFQSFLATTGYPNESRNIALINGSDISTRQSAQDNNGTLDIGEKYINENFSNCLLKYKIEAMVSPINTSQKISDIEIETLNPLFIFPCVLTKYTDKKGYANFDDKPYDLSPGGHIGLGKEDKYKEFSFVPTISAIDLDQGIVDGSNGLFFMNQYSFSRSKFNIVKTNQTPFDDIYSTSINSQHVQINSDLLKAIVNWEIMPINKFLQNKTVKSGKDRDFEATGNIFVGNNVNSFGNPRQIETGDFIVEQGAKLNLTAGQSIRLMPGFKANEGSIFKANTGLLTSCSKSGAREATTKNLIHSIVEIYPLPEIAMKENLDGSFQFDISNYLDSLNQMDYRWILKGGDIEFTGNSKVFTVNNLKRGQYSIEAIINGVYRKTEVFNVLETKNNTIELSMHNEVKNSVESILVYPNPSSDKIKINFSLTSDAQVNIKIKDTKGMMVKETSTEFKKRGIYTEEMAVSDLTNGIYIVEIVTQTNILTYKISIIR
jgi:hypothetical protein